jgi:hypothetical protein
MNDFAQIILAVGGAMGLAFTGFGLFEFLGERSRKSANAVQPAVEKPASTSYGVEVPDGQDVHSYSVTDTYLPKHRCPVAGCQIRVEHSHVEALLKRMRGE